MSVSNYENFLCSKPIPLDTGGANTYCMLTRGHEQRDGTKCTADPPKLETPYAGLMCKHCKKPVEWTQCNQDGVSQEVLIHSKNRAVVCSLVRLRYNQKAEI